MTKRERHIANTACTIMWVVLFLGAAEIAAFGIADAARAIRERETVCVTGSDAETERREPDMRAEATEQAGTTQTRYLACRAVKPREETEGRGAAGAEDAEAEEAEETGAETKTEDAGDAGMRDRLALIDTFLATAYCDAGTTATGTTTTAGRTIAVNPKIIPYGTHVWLYLDDGTLVGDYWAEDTGGNLLAHPYIVDIYMPEYEDCVQWGVQHVSVYTDAE